MTGRIGPAAAFFFSTLTSSPSPRTKKINTPQAGAQPGPKQLNATALKASITMK